MRSIRIVLVLALLAIVAAACGDDEATTDGTSGEMPGWIVSVEPAPGATVAVPDLVRVTFEPTGPDEIVRLLIDGTDVTASADLSGDVLAYDPNQGPVSLGAGEHTATVQLTERPTNDATDFAVIDDFTWTFRTG